MNSKIIPILLLSGLVGAIATLAVSAMGNSETVANPEAASTLLLVINYPYQIWSSDPTKIHVTLFKPDFKPAIGAQVSVNSRDMGKTDKNGTLIFDYVPGNNAVHILKATLSEAGKTYSVTKSFASNSRTESFRADMLYVYTDRGVYNPGQEILCRVIAWSLKGEYSPVPSAKVQLLLQNRDNKVFSGEYVTTNDFGIAETRLGLPENIAEGDYKLVVLFEKAREEASLRVKRFVPPTIDIKHDLPRFLTDAQTELGFGATLSYFAGGAFKSSKLIMNVINSKNEEVFKRDFSSVEPTYKIRISKTDCDAIRSKLIPEADFKIKLSVSDSFGQTDETEWDITYTARPYTCVIELDKDAYPAGEKVQVLVKVTDIDKQPAKKIPVGLEVTETGFTKSGETDDKGVAVFEFEMPAKSVGIIVKSPIVKQPLSAASVPYQEAKPMISKVSEPPKGAGLKTLLTVRFDPGYVPVEKVVHADLTDISGALVASGTIPVAETASGIIAKGEIVSPTWGSMLVNLYCCAVEKANVHASWTPANVGFITEGQHVTFYADRELEITVDNFKPESAPGDRTKFMVSVKGGKGEACIGVSVTDAAVLSLMDPFIRKPVDHFYNPQAKVISTGSAGVLTWPVVDRNWGDPWRDIAYSNWGWKGPGNLVIENERSNSDKVYDSASKAGNTTIVGGDLKQPAPPSKEMMLSANEKSDDSRKGIVAGQTPEDKKIVIRTRFPETAFWNPSIITKDGKASFEIQLPDEITIQRLSIVASDKSGYIGLLQKDVKVTQPLFIRSLLPASMMRGDKLKVQALVTNTSQKGISCTIRLDSKDLSVSGNPVNSVTIRGNDSRIVEWDVSAEKCGEAFYTVTAGTEGFFDSEQKRLVVLPDGEPEVAELRDTIRGGGTLTKQFTLKPGSIYRSVTLNAGLPNVFPALQAWWAYKLEPWYSPWGIAAASIMNSALLAYVKALPQKSDYANTISGLLCEGSAMLVSSQLPSGGWGFYPVRIADTPDAKTTENTGNLYYTIYCLRASCEIRKAGISVNDASIVAAMKYILSKRNDKGLWSSKGVYFWEAFNTDTDNGLSAEAFEVLLLAMSQVYPQSQLDNDLSTVKNKIMNILTSNEPMTISAAIGGFVTWKRIYADNSIDSLIRGNIDRLIALKRTGHWEPHWYNAYGGMVELNARIMSLLAEYDPVKYSTFLREGATWLISTRESWGAWHNEIGTATAVAALLGAGVFAEEIPSEITVTVNGVQAVKLAIDPKDPFLSAARLRYFEITKWVKDGENTVSLNYTGKLEASCIIGIREWTGKAAASSNNVVVERTAAQNGVMGQALTVKIGIKPKSPVSGIIIEESIPSNTEPETKSLEKLIANKLISAYSIKDSVLSISVPGLPGNLDIGYRLIPIRQGKSAGGNTKVRDAGTGDLIGITESKTLNITQ